MSHLIFTGSGVEGEKAATATTERSVGDCSSGVAGEREGRLSRRDNTPAVGVEAMDATDEMGTYMFTSCSVPLSLILFLRW